MRRPIDRQARHAVRRFDEIVGPTRPALMALPDVFDPLAGMRQEPLDIALQNNSLQYRPPQSFPLMFAAMKRKREFDRIGQAQPRDRIMQRADVVIGVESPVLVVVIVHAENQRAIAVRRGVEIPQQVIPRPRIAPRDGCRSHRIAGLLGPLVNGLGRKAHPRVAQSFHQVIAECLLRRFFPPENQFGVARCGFRLEDGHVQRSAKEQRIQAEQPGAGRQHNQPDAPRLADRRCFNESRRCACHDLRSAPHCAF